MSKRTESVAAEECAALGGTQPNLVVYPSREASLGELAIPRALPIKGRRLVGPWCFLDRFGPLTFTVGKPMDVAPHPHIGLQTVSWLLEGEVVHDDSLGYESTVRPGGVNVMTAGAGIAHSEQTPLRNTGRLNGVQLWTALPDRHRHIAPGFVHVEQVPVVEWRLGVVQVFAGRSAGATSPATSLLRPARRRRTGASHADDGPATQPDLRARGPRVGRRLRAGWPITRRSSAGLSRRNPLGGLPVDSTGRTGVAHRRTAIP